MIRIVSVHSIKHVANSAVNISAINEMTKSIVVSEHQLLLFGQDSPETGTSPKIDVGSGYTGRRDVVL